MKKRFKKLTILLIALACGALTALAAGFGPLMHLSDREGFETEKEVRSVLMTGTGRASVILNDASGEQGRYVNRLLLDVYPKEDRPLELTATVWTAEETAEGTELVSTVIRDVNPLYVQTEVLQIGREHVVSVDLESADRAVFSLGDVSVDNSFHFNSFLFLFVTLAAFTVLFLLQEVLQTVLPLLKFRKAEGRAGKEETSAKEAKPAPGKYFFASRFALIALTLGTALVVCLPVNKVGCDEETHLQAVLQLASFPSGELHISGGILHQVTVTEYNNPKAQPAGAEEQLQFAEALAEDSDYKNGGSTPDFKVLWNRVPAYLPMAAAMKAGKFLGLSWDMLLRLARFANLLTYTAFIFLALCILPSGGALMTLIALFPQSLFLACTVSYDTSVTGGLFVGLAYCLRLLNAPQTDRKNKLRDTGFMLFFFVLGCLPKAVYAPLMLSALLIPFRYEKSVKRKRIFTAVVAGLVLAAFLAFILPTLLSPSETGDIRGGAVSEAGQLAFIKNNPLTFLGILSSQMFRWIPQCWFGADCTVFMGHLAGSGTKVQLSPAPFLILLTVLVLSGAAALLAKKKKPFLKPSERLWILLQCLITEALIWTAMYVAFTEPGASEIGGVQGRYFIPLMFPLYFALGAEIPSAAAGETAVPGPSAGQQPAEIKTAEKTVLKLWPERIAHIPEGLRLLVRNEQLWYHLTILVIAVFTALSFLKAVVLPYCM